MSHYGGGGDEGVSFVCICVSRWLLSLFVIDGEIESAHHCTQNRLYGNIVLMLHTQSALAHTSSCEYVVESSRELTVPQSTEEHMHRHTDNASAFTRDSLINIMH